MEKKYVTFRKKAYLLCFMFAIALIYITLLSPYTTLLNNYYGYDTAIWNVIGKGISEGLTPYKDLFDHKGPLLFAIYGFAWSFPNHRIVMFIIQSFSLSIVLQLIFLTAEECLGSSRKAWYTVIFFLILFCGTIGEGAMSEEWCLPFIMLPIYLSIRYMLDNENKNHPLSYSLVYGICFGEIALIRLNNAAPIVGVMFTLFIILISEKKVLEVMKNMAVFAAGVAVAALPFTIWYKKRNALADMLFGTFKFNFAYAERGTDEHTLWAWVVTILNCSALIILIYMFVRLKKISGNSLDKVTIRLYLMTGIMCLFTSIALMAGYSFNHYFTIYIPCIIMVSILVMNSADIIKYHSVKIITTVLIILLIIPYSYQILRNIAKNYLFDARGYYSDQTEHIRDFLSQVPVGDYGKVWGDGQGCSKLYCIAGITPCYKYFDNSYKQFPVCPEMQVETQKMLNNSPPLWIILPQGDNKITCLAGEIRDKYCHVDTLKDGSVVISLYRLNEE